MDGLVFQIRDGEDFLKIELNKRSFPNAELNWDKNWIDSHVSFRARNFRGAIVTNFASFDFEKFKKELDNLYDDLDGQAEFKTLEDQLRINIKGDGIGHFKCEILARESYYAGATMTFNLKFDQTQIKYLSAQLEGILSKYPNVKL